jgi:uncharacterized protein YndB with AHSA1/START domain
MSDVVVEPIRKQITVAVPQATAFEVFTAGMGGWWNPQYRIGAEPMADVIVEPTPGGRWYERGEHGAECDWGRVLAWEPTDRLVLDWQITADWKHDPALHTELEIRFVPDGAASTRVELEHRGLEALGDQAASMHAIFDSPGGWSGLLARYVEAVGA